MGRFDDRVEGLVLGHEITGQVIEAGRDVEFIKVGDLCSVPFKIACGRCRNYKEGKTGICLNVNPDRPGAAYASRLAQARSFGCETIDVGQGDSKDQIADLLGVPEVDCGVDAVGLEARGQDLNYRAVELRSEPLPGQRQAGADDAVAEADVARGVYSPVDLDNVPGRGRKRRWPSGLRSGRRQEGQVAGVKAGRQGLDAAPAEQDVDLAEPGPEPDGAPGYPGPSQACCPVIQRFPDGGTTRSSSTASSGVITSE